MRTDVDPPVPVPVPVPAVCVSVRTRVQREAARFGAETERAMEDECGPPGGQSSTDRLTRAKVVRCGWLRKQGGFVKTWHNRWFVLRGEQLYYYKDEEETKALGAIVLPGNRVTEHPSCGDDGGKFLFEVIPDVTVVEHV
uniref:PH domain-containing protein n=1 Tax=Knipowitschia caucasica TaxID=637954 RepID=A0AAV2IR31_KNICA